uniref:Peptidase C1A papain C-terminal domain-containing protein n=1 Tax=Castor canadensis TaxID=51338 RepID=A0A8C0WBD3_CASCN
MNPFLFLAIPCLGMALAGSALNHTLDAQWRQWKREHNKTHSLVAHIASVQRDSRENENLKMIELHNEEHRQGKHGFTMGMKPLGTCKEFRKMMNGFIKQTHRKRKVFQKPLPNEVPVYMDWREEGYVTPVKNQHQCGSCWAFSATGALEGQMFWKTGQLVSLSEQNLVGYSQSQGNYGCRGGWMGDAFQYVKDNGGLNSERFYPYEARVRCCRYKPEHSAAYDISCVHISFQFYRGGIYYKPDCSSTDLDHAVLVIGYGFDGAEKANRKYWRIKNSWGKRWGMNGYTKMARDKNNHCGTASAASYLTV